VGTADGTLSFTASVLTPVGLEVGGAVGARVGINEAIFSIVTLSADSVGIEVTPGDAERRASVIISVGIMVGTPDTMEDTNPDGTAVGVLSFTASHLI